MQKVTHAAIWEAVTAGVIALVLGILYGAFLASAGPAQAGGSASCSRLEAAGVIGYVEYPIQVLQAGLVALPASSSNPSAPLNSCILPNSTSTSTTIYSGLLVRPCS